jgi:hypothetical protein
MGFTLPFYRSRYMGIFFYMFALRKYKYILGISKIPI